MGALPTFVPLMKAQTVRHMDLEIRADHLVPRERPKFQYETNRKVIVKPQPKPHDVIHVMPEPEPVEPPTPPPSLMPVSHWRVIVRDVCEKHGVILADLLSIRRNKAVVAARHEAMYRMRHETTLSYPQIGKRMGGRDHSTVVYGVWKHEQRLEAMNAQ